jgi:hypothetical protein
MQAPALAAIGGALCVLVVLFDSLFNLSSRMSPIWPWVMATTPFAAALMALVSLFLPGSKWLSWIVLMLAVVGCGVAVWLGQMKPGDWK